MQIKVQIIVKKYVQKNEKNKKNENLNESENWVKNCDLLEKNKKIEKSGQISNG